MDTTWIRIGKAKDSSHLLLIPLLKAFEHVLPSEVLHNLPHKRSIQHKIDLIPGATLPSKPAYHINCQETEEVQ